MCSGSAGAHARATDVGKSRLGETGQRVFGPHPDEKAGAPLVEDAGRVVPADRVDDRLHTVLAYGGCGAQRAAATVASQGDAGARQPETGQDGGQLPFGARHQGAVGRNVDREARGLDGSMRERESQEAVDGRVGAGDRDLPGALTLAAYTGSACRAACSARRFTDCSSRPSATPMPYPCGYADSMACPRTPYRTDRVRQGERARGGGEGAGDRGVDAGVDDQAGAACLRAAAGRCGRPRQVAQRPGRPTSPGETPSLARARTEE